MFYDPRDIRFRLNRQRRQRSLPKNFGILSWNINKFGRSSELKKRLEQWNTEWNIQLLFLQEANLTIISRALEDRYEIHGSANLKLRDSHYGVLTASTIQALQSEAGQTLSREVFIGPKKPYLFTYYSMNDGNRLLCLNLHAINFREHRRYGMELERLKEITDRHEGPIIVAGDFNQWSARRKRDLDGFKRDLDLEEAAIDPRYVKSFMSHPLDFILYRGLQVKRCDAIQESISDHNPLLVEFKS